MKRILPKVNRVSRVSGDSITAGVLGQLGKVELRAGCGYQFEDVMAKADPHPARVHHRRGLKLSPEYLALVPSPLPCTSFSD
jgi:hypothetical protein